MGEEDLEMGNGPTVPIDNERRRSRYNKPVAPAYQGYFEHPHSELQNCTVAPSWDTLQATGILGTISCMRCASSKFQTLKAFD